MDRSKAWRKNVMADQRTVRLNAMRFSPAIASGITAPFRATTAFPPVGPVAKQIVVLVRNKAN